MTDSNPTNASNPAAVVLDEFQAFAAETDVSETSDGAKLQFMLLGLFGEVGSLLSELKKKQRDKNAYFAYEHSALEETGDVLWYLANVASALDTRLSALADLALQGEAPVHAGAGPRFTTFRQLQPQKSLFQTPASSAHVRQSLLRVAARVGRLVHRAGTGEGLTSELRYDLAQLFQELVTAAQDAHISLDRAAHANKAKILDRWPFERGYTPLFDSDYDSDEQFPRILEITFREKTVGGVDYVYQSVNGINLGDRLTDNRADEDNYRFHDVFHLAYAAVLGWSPVLRSLLRLKRKSRPDIDEQQDGARATITEEGIANWVFAHGLRHNAFADVFIVDFALLRTIREMVHGYEVEACPLWMWEEAILQGFAAFRYLRDNRSGVVRANLVARNLTFGEGGAK